MSKETVIFKEGCLSFPFLFLSINRPKWCSVKYTDQHGKEIEETISLHLNINLFALSLLLFLGDSGVAVVFPLDLG